MCKRGLLSTTTLKFVVAEVEVLDEGKDVVLHFSQGTGVFQYCWKHQTTFFHHVRK